MGTLRKMCCLLVIGLPVHSSVMFTGKSIFFGVEFAIVESLKGSCKGQKYIP